MWLDAPSSFNRRNRNRTDRLMDLSRPDTAGRTSSSLLSHSVLSKTVAFIFWTKVDLSHVLLLMRVSCMHRFILHGCNISLVISQSLSSLSLLGQVHLSDDSPPPHFYPHNLNHHSSVETVATDPWMRPGTSDTLKGLNRPSRRERVAT